MIDPASVRLFIPAGLKNFKLALFERIGTKVAGVVRNDHVLLDQLPDDVIPVVGCSLELKELIAKWRKTGRRWIYWDRGYARRVFATWLPRGTDGGYYRWHVGSFQMTTIRDVPDDRWKALKTEVAPWSKGGRHIVVALSPPPYQRFHGTEDWGVKTIEVLKSVTDRPIVIRDKTCTRPLQEDLQDAHCLVAHGSVAAVEAVICGCPVFVHSDSAAALVGLTDLSKIESPIYPDRQPWLNSLAFSQFNERELVDGTLFRLIS